MTERTEQELEVLSIWEYLEKRKEKRKKEEGEGNVLTKIEWNVMIQQ